MANLPSLTELVNSTKQFARYSTNQIYNSFRKSINGVAYTAANLREDLSLKIAAVSGLLISPLRERAVEYVYSNVLPQSLYSTSDETSFALFALGGMGAMMTYVEFWDRIIARGKLSETITFLSRNMSTIAGLSLVDSDRWIYSIPLLGIVVLSDNQLEERKLEVEFR